MSQKDLDDYIKNSLIDDKNIKINFSKEAKKEEYEEFQKSLRNNKIIPNLLI